MKVCTGCKEIKSLENFGADKNRSDKKNVYCKSCKKIHSQEYWARLSEDERRARTLRGRYNITLEEFETLLDSQDGVCAICEEIPEKWWYVDHDHSCCPGVRTCGKCIRGILCQSCNTGLGAFKDNPKRFQRAIAYLDPNRITTYLV